MTDRRLFSLSSLVVLVAFFAPSAGADGPPRPGGSFGDRITLLEEPMPVPDYAFAERLADGTLRDWGMIEFRNRVVVLNFWASWCHVCAGEMPKLDALAGALEKDAIDVLALSIDDEIGQAAAALKKRGHRNLRVFHDTQSTLSALMGVSGVPTTFVVGGDGRAVAVVQGRADWNSAEAKKWLRSLVGKTAPTSIRAEGPAGTF